MSFDKCVEKSKLFLIVHRSSCERNTMNFLHVAKTLDLCNQIAADCMLVIIIQIS